MPPKRRRRHIGLIILSFPLNPIAIAELNIAEHRAETERIFSKHICICCWYDRTKRGLNRLLVRVASLSARKITPSAGRHGVGGSFRPGAVHTAPSLLDRMSGSDSGLVGVWKSALSWSPPLGDQLAGATLGERVTGRGNQAGTAKRRASPQCPHHHQDD